MRAPRKRGYTPIWGMNLRGAPDRYQLELWEQPWHWWLAATLYHWWDTVAFRLPGFRRMERLLKRRYYRRHPHPEAVLRYVPLSNRQDLRCYDLHHRSRVTLARIDLTVAEYERITGRPAPGRPVG